jgi:putative transposase
MLTLPGSPRETALVSRTHGIQFHYLLYWNDVFASPGVSGTKVPLRFDPFDISHVYAFVHNHWVECITSAHYGQFHGHSEREIALASNELRTQARISHTRMPIDAERLAAFLAKIEAHEAVLLQRQRDLENQMVLYRIEHPQTPRTKGSQPVSIAEHHQPNAPDQLLSRVATVDLAALEEYSEYR